MSATLTPSLPPTRSAADLKLERFRRTSRVDENETPWAVEERKRKAAAEAIERRKAAKAAQLEQQAAARREEERQRELAAMEHHRVVVQRREQTDFVMREAFRGHTLKRVGLSAGSDAVGVTPEDQLTQAQRLLQARVAGVEVKSHDSGSSPPNSPRAGGMSFFASERARRAAAEQRLQEQRRAELERIAAEEAARQLVLAKEAAAWRIVRFARAQRWWQRQLAAMHMRRARRRRAAECLAAICSGFGARRATLELKRRALAARLIQNNWRIRHARRELHHRQHAVRRHIEAQERADERFTSCILSGARLFLAANLLRRRKASYAQLNAQRLVAEANDTAAMVRVLELRLDSVERNIGKHLEPGWDGTGPSPSERKAIAEAERRRVREAQLRAEQDERDRIAATTARRHRAATTIAAVWRGHCGRVAAAQREAEWTLGFLRGIDGEADERAEIAARQSVVHANWEAVFAVGLACRDS